MTEKEKREAGLLYNANYDPEIASELTKSRDLCFEYNYTLPSNSEKKRDIINKLLGHVPESATITSPFWCDLGYNIEVGENFFSNYNCVMLDCAKITFGDNVFIAPDCGFYTAGHPIDSECRNKGLEYAHPIVVGNDVWIGGGTKVMPGVTIGNNVVIAAGSIVTKDIPDNVVAAGVPCKVIRQITEKDKDM